MATALIPRDGREVVRCDVCRLVQFATFARTCRRCHSPYEPPVEVTVCESETDEIDYLPIGAVARLVREAQGVSQRNLATRMQVPRTYISKIECAKCEPTIDSLYRLAAALGVPVSALIACAELAGGRLQGVRA